MTTFDSGRCPNCFGPSLGPPCPHCGWQLGQQNPPPALALGEVLDGRYRIGRVLGHGGFGITYLAWDENLQLRLAIKEYLPRDSASRAPNGLSLAVYSGRAGEQFAYGLDRFLDEARALAHFVQHPGIVTVTNFFRANGTGYCVMDYVEGITLGDYLEQQPGGRIGVEAALRLLTPVMDALRAVHKEGLLHRDLAPDNIYISQTGRIKLLDFGAARFAAGEHSKSLSIILKPGYAPEEQYRTKGRQGPWTDVYGLAATFYRAITGQLPPESLDRIEADDLAPPSDLGVAIQPGQESVLLKALAVRATQRYQSITEFQRAWSAVDLTAQVQMSERGGSASPPSVQSQSFGEERKTKLPLILASVGLVAILAMVGFFAWQDASETGRNVVSAPRQESASTTSDTLVGQVPAEHPPSATVAATAAHGRAAYDRENYEQALATWRPLAEAGDPTAQFGLGTMLLDGRGVARDEAEAIRWLRKAADQGIVEAQAKLEELAGEHQIAADPDTPAPSPATVQPQSTTPTEQSRAEGIQPSVAPQGRADTENSSWQSDWGNDIQATARSTPCAVNEFKDQGYQYDLSVDIPITRLRNAEDAWVIAGDRAQTVQGCWFKKEDGLAHAKMIRKRDKKVWEQDLNFADGSWQSSAPSRQAVSVQPTRLKSAIYFASELPPTDDIPPEAPLCYKFMAFSLEEQLRKLKAKYPSLYDENISTEQDGTKTLHAKRKNEIGKEVSYSYYTSPKACNDDQKRRLGVGVATESTGVSGHSEFQSRARSADAKAAADRGDYANAVTIWRTLAEADDAKSQFALGGMYEYGLGVGKDRNTSEYWYRRSADQGEMVDQETPSREFQCVYTSIKKLGTRLSNIPGSGTWILFGNGISLVDYSSVYQAERSIRGDKVKLCLMEIPENCPDDDDRGRTYTVINLRTNGVFTMSDSTHGCGGA